MTPPPRRTIQPNGFLESHGLTRKMRAARVSRSLGKLESPGELIEEHDIIGHAKALSKILRHDLDVEVRKIITDGPPRRIVFENVQHDQDSYDDAIRAVSFEHGGNKFDIKTGRLGHSISFNEHLVLEFADEVEAFVDGEWINLLEEAHRSAELGNAELKKRKDEEDARQEQQDLERRASRIVLRPPSSDPERGE